MTVIPLSEGSFTIDKTKQFVPFNEAAHNLQDRPTGSLLVEIQPFVIITSEDVLLLDTGLGFYNRDGVLQIHQNLMDNGINPGEVTKVLLTHLHKDHAGGLSKEDKITGQKTLSFPNATYYVHKEELDFALATGKPSYTPDEFILLKSDLPRIQLLEGETGIIDDYIRYQLTHAHSKFHQVFWIVDGGETVFFGGDDAPQQQQMKSRFVAKYDYDGKKCMELRQQWLQEGTAAGWTFLFYHDIKTPVFKY